uniref:Uncharacterized protein n=1 Tax=Globodera pallida TaxID=36090 RepID=A0A183CEK3_GLOPA
MEGTAATLIILLAVMFVNLDNFAAEKECAAEAKNMTEFLTNKNNVSCKCHFGEQGKDLSNVPFNAPPFIRGPALECRIGYLNGKGYGDVSLGVGTGEYCYAISGATKKGFLNMWGCNINNNCTEICKVHYLSKCHCKFGEKGVNLSNVDFMLPPFVPVSHLKENRSAGTNFWVFFILPNAFGVLAVFLPSLLWLISMAS